MVDAADEGRVQAPGADVLQAGPGIEGLELEAGAGAVPGQRVQEVTVRPERSKSDVRSSRSRRRTCWLTAGWPMWR